MTTAGALGEQALVAGLRARLDRGLPQLTVPNGDDAACFRVQGQVVATVDSIVAGVDWLVGATPPRAIGHRAAAVNLSDLAAMGARPVALLLALEVAPDADVAAIYEAASGLAELADRFGTAVVGGDLGLAPGPERWSVTALGELEGTPLRRDAARLGDSVWLVGAVGRAAVGLGLLRQGRLDGRPAWARACIQAHHFPQPLVFAGMALQACGARVAAIDVSDGLGLDATRLARASGVALELDLPRPRWLTAAAEADLDRRGIDWREACAAGGDDYALLVTAAPELDVAALLGGRAGGAVVQRIGRVCEGPPGEVAVTVAGTATAPGGWLHRAVPGLAP